MALHATNKFPGDGATTQYEFTFTGGYLDRAHVKVYQQDDVTKELTPVAITSSNFLNATTLTGLPVTPIGSTLIIRRETPKAPLVDFTNQSRFTEMSLDLAARQGLFVAVETEDLGITGLPAGGSDYVLPPATGSTLGGIKVGAGLSITSGGTLSADPVAVAPSDLEQDGATTGQVLTWTGLAWTPVTPSGGSPGTRYKIMIAGDSLTAEQPNLGVSWPTQLARLLNSSGADVDVFCVAINGWTYDKANTTPAFGTATMRDAIVAAAPDMVITCLGINDAVLVASRSLAQIQSDAATYYSALRAALPSASLVYGAELMYDVTHASPSTVLNKHVIPFLMQKKPSGLLAGAFCVEMLGDAVSSTNRTRIDNWLTLDTYIKGLTQVSASFNLPYWKAARLGLIGYDGIHPTAEASIFLASGVRKALQTILPNLSDQAYPTFSDPDGLFNALLTSSGDEWVPGSPDVVSAHPVFQKGPWPACNPISWFMPSRGRFYANHQTTHPNGTVFAWEIRNGPPSSPVFVSVDDAAWFDHGASTSWAGDYADSNVLSVAAGVHTFRYRVGSPGNYEIHGPLVLTFTGDMPGPSSSWQPKVISGANLATTPQDTDGAMVKTYIDFDSTQVLSSHADLTFSKSGKESRIKATVASGKSVWVRLQVTQLISNSTGFDTLWMLGAELLNAGGSTLYHVQMDAKYSPTTDYALVLTGTFVGKLTGTTTFVPWVLTSSSGKLASSAANGFSSFWSLEIINEI